MLSSAAEFRSRIEGIVGCSIRRLELYKAAFTHASRLGESRPEDDCPSYERLEFLGDSMLGFIVAQLIYRKYGELDQGELTKLRSMVVSEPVLAELSAGLGLHELIILGKGEELSGGRDRPSIRSDVFESLVAALYLDRGVTEAKKFVARIVEPEIARSVDRLGQRNYKSRLQEALQSQFKAPPYYKITDIRGPDHDREFTARVSYKGRLLGLGRGPSKKVAEQEAASDTIERWSEFFPDEPGLHD